MRGKRLGVQESSTAQTDLNKYPKVLKNIIKDKKPILYQDNSSAFMDLQAGRTQGVSLVRSTPVTMLPTSLTAITIS